MNKKELEEKFNSFENSKSLLESNIDYNGIPYKVVHYESAAHSLEHTRSFDKNAGMTIEHIISDYASVQRYKR